MPTSARHLSHVTRRHRPRHRSHVRLRHDAPPVATVEPTSVPETSRSSQVLAVTALAVARALRRPAALPESWRAPGFHRDVDLIRTHLRPIRRRSVLAASFGREAFHGVPAPAGDGYGPVTVAYAIRWLELGDGADRPRFAALLAESAPLRGLPAEAAR